MNIVPSDGDIVVTADNKVGLLKKDRTKKKKINTPCKIADSELSNKQSTTDEDDTGCKSIETMLSEMDIGAPIYDDITDNFDIQELIQLMPVVAEKLRQCGYLDTYSKWCHMMSDDTFPVENICSRLFLDVVE